MVENLFDDTVEEVARMPEQPPSPEAEPVPTICCVPGRNELDAAAALLLAYILRFEGGVRRHQVFLPTCRFLVPFIRGSSSKSGSFAYR